MDYSNSVIEKICILLNDIFKKAIKMKIISENPMNDVEKPKSNKQNKKVRALTIEEERTFVEILMKNDINYSEEMLLSLFSGKWKCPNQTRCNKKRNSRIYAVQYRGKRYKKCEIKSIKTAY